MLDVIDNVAQLHFISYGHALSCVWIPPEASKIIGLLEDAGWVVKQYRTVSIDWTRLEDEKWETCPNVDSLYDEEAIYDILESLFAAGPQKCFAGEPISVLDLSRIPEIHVDQFPPNPSFDTTFQPAIIDKLILPVYRDSRATIDCLLKWSRDSIRHLHLCGPVYNCHGSAVFYEDGDPDEYEFPTLPELVLSIRRRRLHRLTELQAVVDISDLLVPNSVKLPDVRKRSAHDSLRRVAITFSMTGWLRTEEGDGGFLPPTRCLRRAARRMATLLVGLGGETCIFSVQPYAMDTWIDYNAIADFCNTVQREISHIIASRYAHSDPPGWSMSSSAHGAGTGDGGEAGDEDA
jgi:hypothetical protein